MGGAGIAVRMRIITQLNFAYKIAKIGVLVVRVLLYARVIRTFVRMDAFGRSVVNDVFSAPKYLSVQN